MSVSLDDSKNAEGARSGSASVVEDMARKDWSATPVGDPVGWPAALGTVVQVMLGSRFPMWMAWGSELTFFCNDAYRRDTLGVKYPWALGRSAREVWAEIWPDIGPRIDRVLRTGEATWDQDLLLYLERSGYREETYHTFSYSPLADDDGDIVGMLCVVSEETERVVAERRMATLQRLGSELSSTIAESQVLEAVESALGANVHDLPFTLTYLFDEEGDLRLAASTGNDPAVFEVTHQLLGGGWWPADVPAGGQVGIVDDLAGRLGAVPCGAWDVPPSSAMVVALRDGAQNAIVGYFVSGLNSFRPLDDAHHGFIELCARQVAAALASARAFELERQRSEALAELDRAKTAFFTNISHEFRTPLTLMLGPLEEALSDPDGLTSRQRERVVLAHRNGQRLLKLVNSLLDFARLESGQLRAEPEAVDLSSETAELASMFRSAVESGGLELVVDCPPLGSPVAVDPHMWELIVTNLVSNAFKHTFAGRIEVRLAGDAKHVTLEVEDTGVGIPPDEMPRLFDRFHRVEGSASRSHEGTGIGLSLVRELVELHGGEVEVDSRMHEGSTFTVTLPRTSVAPAVPNQVIRRSGVGAHVTEAEQWVAEMPVTEPEGDVTDRPTVLIADDNLDMRSYMQRLLSPHYRVVTAADGAEALELVRTEAPDVVVSDVMMPVLSGLDLVGELRTDRDLQDLPVVLLSARAGSEASVEGLDVGADDYLVKPFSADELLGRVAARLQAGADRRRSRLLGALRERLANAADHEGLIRALHEGAQIIFDHDVTSLGMLTEAAQIRTLHEPAIRGGISERYHLLDLGSPAPLAAAARDERLIRYQDPSDIPWQFPTLVEDIATAGIEAAVVAPLWDASGEVIGSVAVSWTSPRDISDLMAADVESVAAVVAKALERIEARQRETRIAEEIQGRLLEIDVLSTESVIAARYRSADQQMLVGGDWYDVLTLDDGRVGLAVGDVVGHGLPAAIAMGQLRSALGAAAATGAEPDAVMAMTDAFARRFPQAVCTTAAYALVDPAVASLRWSCAGHPPPVVVDPGGAHLLWEGRRTPLGVATNGEATVGEIDLAPGSLVFLYTDGLVERRGETLDVGLDRLLRAVDRHRMLPLGELCDRVLDDMAPDEGNRDDVAIVALRTVTASTERFVDAHPATSGALAPARRRLRSWLRDNGWKSDTVDTVLLGIGEAVSNAVEHGSNFDASRAIGIEVVPVGDDLVASVTDSGFWDADSAARSTQLGRGRGLLIMETVAETVELRRSRAGTTALMTFHGQRQDPSVTNPAGHNN